MKCLTLKRILAIFLGTGIILSLAGCGGTEAKKPDTGKETETEKEHDGEVSTQTPEWPEKGKQIRLIITHGVGGSVDTAARGIAPMIEKYLGCTVVPENMVGAGGRKAMQYVYGAEPDGYTIVVSAHPSRLIGELMYPEAKYSMEKFAKLGSWIKGDYRSIIVKAGSFESFEDLMTASKQGNLKAAGGGGVGSTSQLQTVYLKEIVKLDADYIPFESTAEVAAAVIGAQVDFGVMPLSKALEYASNGEVKILAIHGAERSDRCPDVPTMEELGYKGVVIDEENAAYAPPDTPQYIIDKYADAIHKAFDDPAFLDWAEKNHIFLYYQDPVALQEDTMQYYKDINEVLPLLLKDKDKK